MYKYTNIVCILIHTMIVRNSLNARKPFNKFVLSTIYSLGSSLIWLHCLFLVLGMGFMRT